MRKNTRKPEIKQKRLLDRHKQSWERFIANIEHDVHGRQVLAYKIMKMLNRNERETLCVNCIHESEWRKHYSKFWYDINKEQYDNVENMT